MKTVLVLNGKSVLNIIRDVKKILNVQNDEFLVITDNQDEIQPPNGFACRAIGEVSAGDLADVEHLIANGGRTRQLVPLFIRLLGGVGQRGYHHAVSGGPKPKDIQVWDIQNPEERTTKNALLGVMTPASAESLTNDVSVASFDGTIREPRTS